MMKLKDKVAIVTGGARGIGAAIVDRYVAEGARVAVADVNLAEANETAARHGDKAFAVALDVTKSASIDAAVESVVARWGGIDILVNNAGVFDMGPVVEVTEESFDEDVRGQREGSLLHPAGGRQAHDRARAGRQDHQHGLAGGPARRGAGLDLLRFARRRSSASRSRPASISSSTASTSTASRPAWSTRRCGTTSMRCSPSTSTGRSARRSAWSARRCRSGAWDCRRTYGGAAVFLASSDSDYVVSQTLNVDGGNWMS